MNRTLLNTYQLAEAANEISETILSDPKSELMRIKSFLGRQLLPDVRRAQSIIVRSEAELLGVSSPRFAMRVYLEGGGFINCRRLKYFLKTVSAGGWQWGERTLDTDTSPTNRNKDLKPIELPPPLIATTLGGQSCVADSLLCEPERLVKYHFRYVDIGESRLFEIYAEPRALHGGQKPYTSYVKTIDFGGGVCAQAVCFMATSTLAVHATTLCGIAEITTYAHEEDCHELSLSGLTPARMQKYFNRVGLNMTEQAPNQGSRAILSQNESKQVETALRCYLKSNMPIILPVDCRKMAGLPTVDESIYSRNASPTSPLNIPADAAHGIIVIGYSEISDLFVFHDPFKLPYMVSPFSKLAAVSCRRGGTKKIEDNGIFMPVTPARVKLPLLWERIQCPITQEIKSCAGLFTISNTLHVLLHNFTKPHAFSMGHKAPFILSNNILTPNDLVGVPVESQSILAAEINKCILNFQQQRKWHHPRWLWYELHVDSVWIWDAELPPVEGLPSRLIECLKYLVAVVRLKYDANGTSAESLCITTDT